MKRFNIKEWQDKYLTESGWSNHGEHRDIDGSKRVMTHPIFVKAFRAVKKKSPSFSFSDEKSGNKVINKASRAFETSHDKASMAIGTKTTAPTYNPREIEKLTKKAAENYALLYQAINHAINTYGFNPYGGSARHNKRFNIKEWQGKYLNEADMIKYKSKDGESKEMEVDSAKMQSDDHPAKQAWLKTQKDGGEKEKEKVKGADMFSTDEPSTDEPSTDGGDEEEGEEDELESLKAKRDDLQQQRSDVKKDIMANRDDKEMVSMLVMQRDEIKEELEEVEEEIEMLQQMESIQEIIGKTGRTVLARRIK